MDRLVALAHASSEPAMIRRVIRDVLIGVGVLLGLYAAHALDCYCSLADLPQTFLP